LGSRHGLLTGVQEYSAEMARTHPDDEPPEEHSRRKWGLITQHRFEEGIWDSATPCERCLIIIGLLCLLFGCWVLACSEDLFLISGRVLTQAAEALVEVPCEVSAARKKAFSGALLLHLENCQVHGVQISQSTPGFEGLRYFADVLPKEGVNGAWLKVNLQMYTEGTWVSIDKFKNLEAAETFGQSVRVGGFEVSRELAEKIPGDIVPLAHLPQPLPAHLSQNASQELDAHTMVEQDDILYSGSPGSPLAGDVRVWLTAGDARHVSVIGAIRHEVLKPWYPAKNLVDVVVTLPSISQVTRGPVAADEMLQYAMPQPVVDKWPLWGFGFCCVWLGMSLMLFPNHVGFSCCASSCCLRGSPGAMVTSAVTILASQCFLNAPAETTVVVLLLMPLLVLTGAGIDVKRRARRFIARMRRRLRHRKHDHPNEASDYAELLGHAEPGPHLLRQRSLDQAVSKAARIAAVSIGLGLVVAGPIVRTMAIVDFFGFYVYAATRT